MLHVGTRVRTIKAEDGPRLKESLVGREGEVMHIAGTTSPCMYQILLQAIEPATGEITIVARGDELEVIDG